MFDRVNTNPLDLSPSMYKQWLAETQQEDICWWAEGLVYTLSPYSKSVDDPVRAMAIIDMARKNTRDRGVAFPLDCYGDLESLLG